MLGRIENQNQNQGRKGGGVPLPSISGKIKKMAIIVILAVFGVVFMCSAPVWVLGWFGWNAVGSHSSTANYLQHPAQVIGQIETPITCPDDQWLMSWNTAQGKQYACTPQWK